MAREPRPGLAGRWFDLPSLRRNPVVPVSVEDVETLSGLINGQTESRDRSKTIRSLKRVADGKVGALYKLKPHTTSMRDGRAGDRDLMLRVEQALGNPDNPGALSRLASLYTQMRRWDDALALYDRLEAAKAATAIDHFLAFQIARIEGRRDRLEDFDPRQLAPLASVLPEVHSDIVARHLTLGAPGRFAREIRGLPGRETEADMLASMARGLAGMPLGSDVARELWREQRDDWNRILAVCSLRCSGGAAIQDFIEDHPGVRTSAGEYVALSGYMGLRSARMAQRPRIRAVEFVRQHLLGMTVPISRSHSRILRQARADRAAGRIETNLAAVHDALRREDTLRGVLDRLLLNIWGSYLDAEPGSVLLLKKLFTQGQLELLAELPPLRCVMVWRDPRDQYADQVDRGFCRAGDIDGFVSNFETRISALRRSLAAASPEHRALFVNVSFEAFVGDAGYRETLRGALGLNPDGYAPERFVPEMSQANVGIWRSRCNPADIAQLEARLRPWLDTTAIRLGHPD